jgi:histidine kinase/DNA gyrase B/HSP90-like ATPase
LGLSIVHGIVVAHGGRIDVSSRSGEGSEFRITLPRAGRDAAAATIAVAVFPRLFLRTGLGTDPDAEELIFRAGASARGAH